MKTKRTKANNPKNTQRARAARTAARKARQKKALAYKLVHARAKAGEEARANDPTGRLEALYQAFIPVRNSPAPSKFVSDRWGNRVLRSELEAETEELASV